MKKLIFFILIFFIIFSLKSQVYNLPNGGFEDWEGSGDSEEPVKWNSFKTSKCDLSIGCNFAQVKKIEKTTDIRPGSSGSYSCKIFATKIMGVIANGNLTTGRIRVGSATATSSENYNFSQRSDNNFSQKLDAKPDSLVFWAKFVCPSASQEASVVAIIHDDYDYKDPNTIDPNLNGGNHIVGKCYKFFTKGSQNWIRYSLPFSYDYSSPTPKYILINVTTNKLSGEGDVSDALYVDDFQLVYNVNAYSIKVNGTTISGFNPNLNEYNITFNCGTLINITAEAASNNATVNIVQANASNNYTATITISNGDQSKQILIHATPVGETFNIDDDICQGKAYNANGFNLPPYSNIGVYNLSQLVPAGENCFNTVNLNLSVHQNYNYSSNTQICVGASIDFYGETLNEVGVYSKNFTTIYGCDSTYTLNLTIGDRFEQTINATICEGETYTENGFNENKDGTYSIKYTASMGCDSVVYLYLKVGKKYITNLEATICEGSIYSENGFKNLTKKGNYTQNLKSFYYDCDSIINLNLIVIPNEEVKIFDEIYYKEPYYLNGFEIFETDTLGTFEYFLFDSLNCLHKTLILTIKEQERPPLATASDFIFKIYPNPATTYFIVEIDDYEANDISYFLYNSFGSLVQTGQVIGKNFIIHTSNLNSGIYILKLRLSEEYEKPIRVMVKYNYE